MLGCCKHNYMPIWAASCGPRVNVLYHAFSAAARHPRAHARGKLPALSCRKTGFGDRLPPHGCVPAHWRRAVKIQARVRPDAVIRVCTARASRRRSTACAERRPGPASSALRWCTTSRRPSPRRGHVRAVVDPHGRRRRRRPRTVHTCYEHGRRLARRSGDGANPELTLARQSSTVEIEQRPAALGEEQFRRRYDARQGARSRSGDRGDLRKMVATPRRHTAPTTAPQAPRLAPRDGLRNVWLRP